MADHVQVAELGSGARVLERCIESYSAGLSQLGYCAVVIRQKRSMVASFARWMGRRRLDIAEIDEAAVDAYLAHLRA